MCLSGTQNWEKWKTALETKDICDVLWASLKTSIERYSVVIELLKCDHTQKRKVLARDVIAYVYLKKEGKKEVK